MFFSFLTYDNLVWTLHCWAMSKIYFLLTCDLFIFLFLLQRVYVSRKSPLGVMYIWCNYRLTRNRSLPLFIRILPIPKRRQIAESTIFILQRDIPHVYIYISREILAANPLRFETELLRISRARSCRKESIYATLIATRFLVTAFDSFISENGKIDWRRASRCQNLRNYTNVSFGTEIVGNGSEGRVREYSARYEMSLFDRASFNFQKPCRKKKEKKNSNLRAKRREERKENSESSVTKLYISCYKKKDRWEDGRGVKAKL